MVTQPEREQGTRLESPETKFWSLDHSIPLGHCSTLGKEQSREARHVLQLWGKGRGIGERLKTHSLLSTILGGRDRFLYHPCGDRTYQSWINSHNHSDEKARYHSGSIWLQSPYFFSYWLGETDPSSLSHGSYPKTPPNLIKIDFFQGLCTNSGIQLRAVSPCSLDAAGLEQAKGNWVPISFRRESWQLWGQGSFGKQAPAAT